jgi:hypothetical protein
LWRSGRRGGEENGRHGDDTLRDGELTSSSSQLEEELAVLPKFPSLQVGLLQESGKLQANFPLNSRRPIDVETELFKGKIIFVVLPANPEDDPYWNKRIFSKRKRRMVIQIQGKFKHEPQGVVYAGAEVSNQMKMGVLARGLCNVLLNLVVRIKSNVHYSFGDSKDLEKPHIVAPAYTFFEQVVITAPGESPPPMDNLFEETNESIAHRRASKATGNWNTMDTYSLSFYSMYIDLPTWHLIGLPVSGAINLKTFWSDSLLRLCMYEKMGTDKRHLQESNRYAFAVQVRTHTHHHGLGLSKVVFQCFLTFVYFFRRNFLALDRPATTLISKRTRILYSGRENGTCHPMCLLLKASG